MKGSFSLVLLIILLLFWALNYYIGLRGWQYLGSHIPYVSKILYWSVFWLLAFSYILARVTSGYLPSFARKGISLIGGYWMAAMLYFILLIVLIDLFRLILRWTSLMPRGTGINSPAALMWGISVFLLVAFILAYGTWNARTPVVNKYDNIAVNKKAGSLDQLHVVMASDVHLGSIMDRSRLTELVDMINRQNPDIVLLPGDILDDDVETFEKQKMWEVMSQIKSRYGTFASLGNHEYISNRVDDAAAYLEKSGVQVLRDGYTLVNNSFYIVGRNDQAVERYTGKGRKPLAEILEGVDKSKPLLLMDHQPVRLDEAMANGIDLQVSGHTHRGQMFPNQFITKRTFELDWGYLLKGSTHYIVSSGFGTWGPPIRTGQSP